MKAKTKKFIRGSITVLVVIILLPMMTMSAIVVDSSRINMARSMVSSAGDLAMNSALANYDTILKDVYGLFAMSQSMTDEEFADEIKNYFAQTLVSYGVVNEAESGDYVEALMGDFKELLSKNDDSDLRNFLQMTIEDNFSVKKVEESSLANPEILRSQIVEYMKYRAPMNFGLSFLDSLKAFQNIETQNKVVSSQVAAQEKTQDVTSTCKQTIDDIRDFDKLIDSIQGGEKTVKGNQEKSDNLPVLLDDYHTQVDGYKSTWGNNYKKANELVLVFLLKAPGVSSRYLYNMDIKNSQWFVASNNTKINYTSCGINTSPALGSNTAEAKTKLTNQLNLMNSSTGTELKTATAYASKKGYLNSSCYNANNKSFADKSNAITTFVEFEKMLTDTGDIKYSDVKKSLEGLYTLGKYYDDYYKKISDEITAAQNEKTAAESELNDAKNAGGSKKQAVSNNVTAINNANKNFKTAYDFLSGVKNGEGEDLKTVFEAMLAQNTVKLPTKTKNAGGQTITDFSGFVNSTYKENSSDADNKYMKVFKEIIGSKLKKNASYKDVCTIAEAYLTEKSAGTTTKSFSKYFTEKCGALYSNNPLYLVLNHLYTNSESVGKVETAISNYNSANSASNYQKLTQKINDATAKINNKTTERNDMQARFQSCIGQYNTFCKCYQDDLSYYGQYVKTASNEATTEVKAVCDQFKKICENIKSIIDKLTAIDDDLTAAKTAIEAYNTKVDAWKTANDNYANECGSDSFSKQNSSDIDASKEQYDTKSLATLQSYVQSVKSEYQDFYNVLMSPSHFKYGTKRYDAISDSASAKTAVSDSVKNSLPAVITAADAASKLDSLCPTEHTAALEIRLYNKATTAESMQNDWYFLKPSPLPIAFLQYLNESYKPDSAATNDDKSTKTAYKSAKTDLENDSGKSVDEDITSTGETAGANASTDGEETKKTDKFGYSYADIPKLSDETIKKLPSSDAEAKTPKTSNKFKLSEDKDSGNIDASSDISKQSSNLSSVLSGIGNVAEGMLEDVYILSYLFENFSYNTLVQDMLIEGEGGKDNASSIGSLANAKTLMTADTIGKYKDKSKTLSNYSKNAYNNYFYGSEIEYILYGNAKASTNVTYARASIYAIRFAFNCIYAFTNSEIRNTTMAAGMAVQAATLGVVPYQIVQVVLQLALAAAESAIDLDMMKNGLKVAVVKTESTWSLSIKGTLNGFKEVAGEVVGKTVETYATKAVSQLTSGVCDLMDMGADELSGGIDNLISDLSKATTGKVQEIIDSATATIQSSIEKELNKLNFIDYELQDATETVNKAFDGLSSSIRETLESNFAGNPVADAILPEITNQIDSILQTIKDPLITCINQTPIADLSGAITNKVVELKNTLNTTMKEKIESLYNIIDTKTQDIVSDINGKLQGYATQAGEKLSEKASNELKEKVKSATDNFIGSFLESGNSAISSGAKSVAGSKSAGSIISFGYKDYLMLFTFLSITVNDSNVLKRTADVIQLNIQNAAADQAEYSHKSGSNFTMKKAKTYVAIDATVDLDMLFLNMDFFTRILTEEDADSENSKGTVSVEGDFTPAASIKYNGLYGY